MSSAKRFVQNRTLALTQKRVEAIVGYLIQCYLKLQSDAPTYSRSWVRSNTTLMFEDFLKLRYIDDYLKNYKKSFSSTISPLEELIFTAESVKTYTSSTGIEHPDKIDISILNLGLQNVWNGHANDDIYFSIECKIINILSDTSSYILDIEKYVNRSHTTLRIPFEGMIAFIESNKLNHVSVSFEINKRLHANTTIKTIQYLKPVGFHSAFSGSYNSTQKKNFGKKQSFTIYHLLFDYSKNITI